MEKIIKDELGKYWEEINSDKKLIKDIEKARATSFFIQLTGVIEKNFTTKVQNHTVMDTGRNTEFLLSARDMLNLYTDVIQPASKKYSLTISKMSKKIEHAMNKGDVEKVEKLTAELTEFMMDPLYQNANNYGGNDITSKKELAKMDKDDLSSLKITGAPQTLFAVMDHSEKVQKMRNAMEVAAIDHYMKYIDKEYSGRSKEAQSRILEYIKDHPKAVMALYFSNEATKEKGGQAAHIFSPEDLRAKCEMPEVQDLAAVILLTDRQSSFKVAAHCAKKVKGLDKPRGITREVDDNKVLLDERSMGA